MEPVPIDTLMEHAASLQRAVNQNLGRYNGSPDMKCSIVDALAVVCTEFGKVYSGTDQLDGALDGEGPPTEVVNIVKAAKDNLYMYVDEIADERDPDELLNYLEKVLPPMISKRGSTITYTNLHVHLDKILAKFK